MSLTWGRSWFSPGPPVSSTDKTDRHDITEIVLKVAFSTIKPTNQSTRTSIFLISYVFKSFYLFTGTPAIHESTEQTTTVKTLRKYQEELAEIPLRGENCLICAVTNAGKTLVAFHIIEEHFRRNPDGMS